MRDCKPPPKLIIVIRILYLDRKPDLMDSFLARGTPLVNVLGNLRDGQADTMDKPRNKQTNNKKMKKNVQKNKTKNNKTINIHGGK